MMLIQQMMDFNRNEARNPRIHNLSSAPSSPVVGQEYFDTTTNHLWVWTGSIWEQASGGGGTGTVTNVSNASQPSFFNFTIANPSTTPAFTFAMATGQTANMVLATPNGSTGALALRALVPADMPTFDTQVRTSRLDQMAAPTSAVGFNSQKITGLANGTVSSDAATYGQLVSMVNGVAWKAPVLLIARSNITLSGEQTIDGFTTSASRVAVTGQTTGSQNGFYTTSSGAWVRTADLASGSSAASTAFFVEEGTSYQDTQWIITNDPGGDVVGTNSLTFQQFGATTSYTADETTLHLTGTVFSIKSTYVGQTSITTLGTISSGTWNGTTIAVANGGTGATTASGARTNLGAMGRYSALIGDGTSTSYTINQSTHGLANSCLLHVQVFDATTGAMILVDVTVAPASGNVTVTFSSQNVPASNAFRVVIQG